VGAVEHSHTEITLISRLYCARARRKNEISQACQTHWCVRATVSLKMGITCNVAAYRNAVTLQVTDTIRSYDLNFHPVPQGVTVSCERYSVGFPVCHGSQKARTAHGSDMSRCKSRPAQAVTILLMFRLNTESASKMPVTLPRDQLLIRYVVTSLVHTVTMRCYGTR
jgi:hypothetical protein